MFNNDAAYAKSRIVGTYLFAKENKEGLFRIVDIVAPRTNRLDKSVLLVKDREGQSREANIDFFRFAAPPLGWVNPNEGEAFFLARGPVRKDYKQGLRANQLYNIKNAGLWTPVRDNFMEVNHKPVSRTLEGVYPSLDRAIELVEEYSGAVAFSRAFCLSGNYKLLYRGSRKVGTLDNTDKLKLDNEFNFLQQELEAEVGHQRISV